VKSKPCNGKKGQSYKKPAEKVHTVGPSAIRRNANVEPETYAITYSRVTEERSLRFTYQNLGNFRGFYSRNVKSHKKSSVNAANPSFIRRKA